MVADYIGAANISGIGTVFASPPKISRSSDALANVPAGTPSGSVIYVEVLESHEIRVAVGGPVAGKKTVTHSLRLHLLFRSVQPLAQDAMDDHDDILEQLLQLLRADRTLGSTVASPHPIFQNGEGDAGIAIATGMPKESGTGSTIIWSLVDTSCVEFITA
jgi:hypothetical protein